MTITINVRGNVDRFIKDIDRVAKKQMPYATSMAINTVARKAEIEIMKQLKTLDRPVSYTLNSSFVSPSNKNKKPISATVGIKDRQSKYLQYVEYGGTSIPNGRAKPVPTRSSANAHGNLPRGTTKKIGTAKVFSGSPPGRPSGVYQKMGTKKNPKLKMLAHWEPATQHNKRTRIEERVRIVVERNFDKELEKQFRAAVG